MDGGGCCQPLGLREGASTGYMLQAEQHCIAEVQSEVHVTVCS